MNEGIVPYDPTQDESMENVKPRLTVLKVKYNSGFFEAPALQDANGKPYRVESFTAGLIKLRGGLRRLYLSDYDESIKPEDRTPPECCSVDGKEGSAPQQLFTAPNGSSYHIYGSCSECLFSRFGSAGIYKGDNKRGQKCSQYALALLMVGVDTEGNGGFPVILQLPPTSSELPSQIATMATQKAASPIAFLWEFFAEGGGRSRKSIAASIKAPMQAEGIARIQRLQRQWRDDFEHFCHGFVGGRTLDDLADGNESTEQGPITV